MNEPSTPCSVFRERMIAVLLFLVLPAIYFMFYVAALDGKVYRSMGVDPVTSINRFAVEPRFRILHGVANIVFKPALLVDQHIRHEYWNTIENKLSGRKWRNR